MSPKLLHPGSLVNCELVILNNIPSTELPESFLNGLTFFVEHQGNGLLMTGGKYSYGSGGYFNTSVAELLPVSMELKEDHKKLAVAMAFILDRSGSMGASVGSLTKMDLANNGVAEAIHLLGKSDAATVIAVDSEPNILIPMTGINENRDAIASTVRRLRPGGGGIFVYTGLKAALKEMENAEFGQRHIILFSDAADSEEPGDYKQLIKDFTSNKGSISVIALGTEQDADAEFLKDIARRGNGRIFFSQNPVDIPLLFSRETVAVARSAFIEELTPVRNTASWLEISSIPLEGFPAINGYNLSYPKESASVAIQTTDEYMAPLVSYWQKGSGRVASYCFPLNGPFARNVQSWDQLGDFIQTLCRWLIQQKDPDEFVIKSQKSGDHIFIDLYQEEMGHSFQTPTLFIENGISEEVRQYQWSKK